jgi:predicted dehydrogenase
MSATVSVALAGIAGYGDSYLEQLLPRQQALGIRLVGVVDPQPQRCRWLDELRDTRVPVHATMSSLFATTAVDLMLIVTPIHLHAEQTLFALRHGAHVLCEKPLAGCLEDALKVVDAQRTARGFAAIGYQWSFSQAVGALKRDIQAGVLGRPVRLKTIVLFPRPISYFTRNDWAGKTVTTDGRGVFDSPVNNAAAHYLHNMFYVLGPCTDSSAVPACVQAELYRANAIDNYDTAALRCTTRCGAEILFYTTHACVDRRGPRSRFEFEDAVVEYDALSNAHFVARFRDGRVKNYGQPTLDRHEKIWQSIDAARNGGGSAIACGASAALSHALCVDAAQRSTPQIGQFPPRLRHLLKVDGEDLVCIDRLAEQLGECYERAVLPSEHGGATWSQPATPIELPAASAATTRPREGVAVKVHAADRRRPAARPN